MPQLFDSFFCSSLNTRFFLTIFWLVCSYCHHIIFQNGTLQVKKKTVLKSFVTSFFEIDFAKNMTFPTTSLPSDSDEKLEFLPGAQNYYYQYLNADVL